MQDQDHKINLKETQLQMRQWRHRFDRYLARTFLVFPA